MEQQDNKGSDREILTVAEVAEYLRVHTTTIYRLLKTRKLPAFRVGSDWRFFRDDIDSWIRGRASSMR